jgi:hypothetical protein
MLIYYCDEQGDHLVETGRGAEILADAADETADLLTTMADLAGIDLAWAESREIAAMERTCAQCPAREACRSYLASAMQGERPAYCGNAMLFDMIWVRAAVEGGWLAAQTGAVGRVA